MGVAAGGAPIPWGDVALVLLSSWRDGGDGGSSRSSSRDMWTWQLGLAAAGMVGKEPKWWDTALLGRVKVDL